MYYFASDMHLGLGSREQSREREDMAVEWLDRVSADAKAIYLLGDIFDFWFEYRSVVPKGFVRLLAKMAELTGRGIEIHFFTGNHDIWTFGYLEKECGLTIHRRPQEVEIYGKRLFLAHGDNIGRRTPREKFQNWLFRNRTATWLTRNVVHPDILLGFGHGWSDRSRTSNDAVELEFRGEREPLVRFARETMQKGATVDYFIFGHLHLCADYPLDDRCRAIFLGDWMDNPSYAALHPDGKLVLERINL